MADDFLNIDLVFRNGLKDYEDLPPEEVWISVQTAIARKKAVNARLLIGRAAAVAMIAASAGTLLWVISSGLSDEIKRKEAITFNQDQIPAGNYVPVRVIRSSVNKADQLPEETVHQINMEEPVQTEKNLIPEQFKVADLTGDIKTENRYLPLSLILPGPATGTNPGGDKNNEKEFTLNNIEMQGSQPEKAKWRLGASFLPAYYSKFSFGKNDAAKDYIKEEDLAFSYSGGFSLAFRVSGRFSVQAGMALNNMGQKIEGLASYSGFIKYTEAKNESDFSIITASGTINSVNKDIFFLDTRNMSRVLSMYTADVFDPSKAELQYVGSSLIQNLRYLELPVSLRYKVIDRTVDISVSGGLSYNLLVGNTSYVQSEGVKYIIGKTTGLSPVTFSSSLGLGMEYKLSPSMTFSVEPLFRYYITPLGGVTGSSIHPYSFGVMSGFFYNF